MSAPREPTNRPRRAKPPAPPTRADPTPRRQRPAPPSPASGETATHAAPARPARPSALLDTRIIYCGDNLDQLSKLPAGCIDHGNLWGRFLAGEADGNRNYEVFPGDKSEPRTPVRGLRSAFEHRHASIAAYIDYMRPRCVELARVLKGTGSFSYHCDWHACHYVNVMSFQRVSIRAALSRESRPTTRAVPASRDWIDVCSVSARMSA